MYSVEDKGEYFVYTFNGINLKIRSVENENNVFVMENKTVLDKTLNDSYKNIWSF
jgi:hypothetical protein